jgi:hypothetical protein
MPLATSAATDALAHALAALRGVTPDEAVASALRAQLDCQRQPPLEDAQAKSSEALQLVSFLQGLGLDGLNTQREVDLGRETAL